MSDHPLSLFAVAMLFAAMAAAADRSDTSNDRRDPNVREAQAAKLEAQRGGLQDDSPAQQERNKFSRCEGLPSDDRDYCILRMKGEGTISGSVEGGGILRELRVTVPAK
jgi:hypothetical protein